VENEIFQLKITVSTQKDAVDIHKAKVNKQDKLVREASNSEDADLTTQVDDLKAELTKLQNSRVNTPFWTRITKPRFGSWGYLKPNTPSIPVKPPSVRLY
jgi:hypothetical protein